MGVTMNLFRLLRYLLPLQNPAGFGLSDFLLLGLAVLFAAAILLRLPAERALRQLSERPLRAGLLLAALPVILRLLLLHNHPVPVPSVSDDFSYLLLGDTLAHLRLANPPHPMQRFFETVFVLQEPSYSSIYPPGQGIILAMGQWIFRSPWAGVVLSVGMLCGLCYWMLLAWVPPVWAFAGGLLAVMEFGPLNQWMNNYWGGAVSGIAGCLVFGALPRLWKTARPRDAALLGLGLGLQVLTRPYESVLLSLCILPALWPAFRRNPRRLSGAAALALLPALLLTAAQNKAVTGSFTSLPYMLSRQQYGIPATFTFQKNPVPSRPLNQEQSMDYQAQNDVHGNQPETPARYLTRFAGRVKFFRFFFYPPLYIALLFLLPELRRRRYLWAAGCVLLLALGTNFFPYYYPHYIAAATCLCILLSIAGLRRLAALRIRGFATGQDAMRLVALFCGAQFVFWYGVHLIGNDDLFIATGPFESWDYINFGDAESRSAVNRRLAAEPGRQLVFVRYSPQHLLREWVHNAADIDASPVVWALDLGNEENARLRQYYPARKAWLIEPDVHPPRLRPYPDLP